MGFDSGGGGGVSDHGNLTGLGDDDHSQYITGTRDPLEIPTTATAANNGIAIGDGAEADSGFSSFPALAIGRNADATRNETTSIGHGATNGGGISTVAVGTQADAGFNGGVAIGRGAAGNTDAVAIGENAGSANGDRWIAIGEDSDVTVNDGMAVGHAATVATADVSRIGFDQFVFGGTRDTIADADLNNGELLVELDEANSAFRLRGKDSTGTVREATVAW